MQEHYQHDGLASYGAANNDDSKGNPAAALLPRNFRAFYFNGEGSP